MRQVSLLSYAPALLAAILKDILDLVFGWIPGIGAIITLCFSLMIFFLLLLAGSGGKWQYSLARKGGFLLVGTAIESVPVLSVILPLETFTVYLIYRADRKAAEKTP